MNKESVKMIIKIDTKIYDIDVIRNAACSFIDRAFILLEKYPKNKRMVKILLKPKKNLSLSGTKKLKNEFMNELLYSSLRYQISKNNKKIREYIVGCALYSSLSPNATNSFINGKTSYLNDEQGIAIPWEEKYKKK